MFDISWIATFGVSLLIGVVAFVASLIYYRYKDKNDR